MSNIKRVVTNSRRGRAVVYNGIAFLGGQTAVDREAGIEEQTRQALEKVDRVLAELGSDRSQLLSAQIWLKDITRDFAGMNAAWDAWINPATAPARATAQCEMGAPDVLVEVIVTAAAG